MNTLTWKVDKTVPTACPDYQPDSYTGEYPSIHCLVYHCKTFTEERSKEFSSKEEAQQFINKAPLSCYEFKFDGVILNDTRDRSEVSHITLNGESMTMAGTGNIITFL